ncbi:MAG: ATP-grasp domain-containing protein [Rhodospirillales bacterium]|nr:ATP-grasp domain-containing protein [Rhodospirillales bacterium]
MIKLLFTGGGGAGNEAIFRLWQDQYDLHFADAQMDVISPSIPDLRHHVIPLASSDDFTEKVAELCRQLEIDILVPGVDEELPLMPGVCERAPDTKILLPDAAYVATMGDKLLMARALAEKDINVPATAPLKDASTIGFPCIAKPRVGRGSRGFAFLDDQQAADAYEHFYNSEAIAQELLEGQEYTVMMAADGNGNLAAVVPVRVDVKRGITLKAETESNEAVIQACQAIHAALPVQGCYNIQLMVTGDGRVLPFEINPRISTTCCLGIIAGIDPVEIFLGDSSLGQLLAFTPGVILRRFWMNNFGVPSDD